MDHPSPTRFADRVSLTVADGIADVVLVRLAKRSALGGAMIEETMVVRGATVVDTGFWAVVRWGAGGGV